MNYESTEQAVAELRHLEQTLSAYNHAEGVLYLDATTAAPSESYEGRGKTMEIFSRIRYDLITDPKNDQLVCWLSQHAEELDPQTASLNS